MGPESHRRTGQPGAQLKEREVAAAQFLTESTPIWVLPGLDLGPVLDQAIGVPAAPAPVFELLKFVGG